MNKSNYDVWTCPRCRHQIEPHQGGNLFEEGRQHMHDHVTEDYAMTTTHETVGDYYAIAPEIISTTPTPRSDTVLNWAGENFTVQRPALDRAELLSLLDSAYGSPLAHHQAIADRIMRLGQG